MQWQPIDTAPKDGTSVLLLGRGGRYADGFWEQKIHADNGCWVWPYVRAEPTHWMPLPPIPVPDNDQAPPTAHGTTEQDKHDADARARLERLVMRHHQNAYRSLSDEERIEETDIVVDGAGDLFPISENPLLGLALDLMVSSVRGIWEGWADVIRPVSASGIRK